MIDERAPVNGQAWRTYLASAQALSVEYKTLDYYPLPIPSEIDGSLRQIVMAFTALAAEQRHQFMSLLTAENRAIFAVFGHRAATLAVRTTDPEWLRAGLLGNVIANFIIPERRDVRRALAVFYHCARKLDIDPRELFKNAAHFAGDEMAGELLDFSALDDVRLKDYGWREIRTQEGIVYRIG